MLPTDESVLKSDFVVELCCHLLVKQEEYRLYSTLQKVC